MRRKSSFKDISDNKSRKRRVIFNNEKLTTLVNKNLSIRDGYDSLLHLRSDLNGRDDMMSVVKPYTKPKRITKTRTVSLKTKRKNKTWKNQTRRDSLKKRTKNRFDKTKLEYSN